MNIAVKVLKSKKKGKAKKGNGPKDKPTKKYVGQGKQETRWKIGYNANTDTLIHYWYLYTKSENKRNLPLFLGVYLCPHFITQNTDFYPLLSMSYIYT